MAWGGFNVVQASLNAVALALEREIPFHWLWILSGTTYPIASNDAIREKLSSHHPEAVSTGPPLPFRRIREPPDMVGYPLLC